MSLPVYYDSILTGLTDSLWGREAVKKKKERGKADSTKDAPLPPWAEADARRASFHFPAWQKQMGEGGSSASSPLHSRMWNSAVWLKPEPASSLHVMCMFLKISWVISFTEQSKVSFTRPFHRVKAVDITHWAIRLFALHDGEKKVLFSSAPSSSWNNTQLLCEWKTGLDWYLSQV